MMRLPLPLGWEGFGLATSQQSTVKGDPEWTPWKERASASIPLNLPLESSASKMMLPLQLPADWKAFGLAPGRRSRQSTRGTVWKGSGMEDSIPMEGCRFRTRRCRGDAPTKASQSIDHATKAYGGLQAGRKATGSLQPP
jgi:hypothetical protein